MFKIGRSGLFEIDIPAHRLRRENFSELYPAKIFSPDIFDLLPSSFALCGSWQEQSYYRVVIAWREIKNPLRERGFS
jgi:hypothetical protein